MSTDIKLSKIQISKIFQLGGFLGALLSKLAGPLMKVEVPSTKKYFSCIRNNSSCFNNWGRGSNKICGSWTTFLIISYEKMNDKMKIVQALEDSCILLKGITKTIENETEEQKGGFLGMLLVPLGAALLGNMLKGKGILRAVYRSKIFNSTSFFD